MADISINKFRTAITRGGATPATPGFAETEGQDPVNPSGANSNHNPVTIGSPANGLSITTGQELTIGLASAGVTGALSGTDWNTFNGKLNLTSPITGYTVGANTALADTDTVLSAFGKIQGQINARVSGTIASGQVAFGTGTGTIGGGNLTWNNTSNILETSGASTLRTSNGNLTIATNGGNGNIEVSANGTGFVQVNKTTDLTTLTLLRFNTARSWQFQTVNNGASTRLELSDTTGGKEFRIIDSTVANSAFIINPRTNTISNITGELRFTTGGGNGNINIVPNGTGLVGIAITSPTNTLDVNGTARIRTISNLGSTATRFLVASATGVISERTGAELVSDLGISGGSNWTIVGSDIYRNSSVAIGRTTIPTNATFAVQSRTTTGAAKFIQILNNSGSEIFSIQQDSGINSSADLRVGGATGIGGRGPHIKGTVSIAGNTIFRVENSSSSIHFDINGDGETFIYKSGLRVGGANTLGGRGPNFRGTVSTALAIFRIENSGGTNVFDVNGDGSIQLTNGGNFILGTTTGTKIGTATNQKLAFYNSTPIVQPSGDILTALSNLGLVASPTITPVDESTAKTTASADQTLPSGVLTILDYDTTVINNNTSIYTVGTTGRITVNSTGIYTITAGVVVEADAVTALESAFLGIFRNGDLVAISSINTTIAAGAQSGLSTSTILSLTSGDIIDCRALVNSVGGVANGLARRLGTLLGANATQVNSLSITKSSQ